MNRKLSKKKIMDHYYSDEELRDMLHMSVRRTLVWLEEARRFVNKITPRSTKALQEKMMLEGW